MTGEIWIDPVHLRVVRLEGHLQQDVDFGWGILGRLNKGGWIVIEQADVGGGQWRTVRFQMQMSGRVVFKNPRVRHHGGANQLCAAARGNELPESHRNVALRQIE